MKAILLFGLVALIGSSFACDPVYFNVYVLGDYNCTNSLVDGRLATGRDVRIRNTTVGCALYNSNPSTCLKMGSVTCSSKKGDEPSIVCGRNGVANSLTVVYGHIYYANSWTKDSKCKMVTDCSISKVDWSSVVINNFKNLKSQSDALTSYYAVNGVTTVSSRTVTLSCTTDYCVFSVRAEDLNSANTVALSVPSSVRLVIINVSGTVPLVFKNTVFSGSWTSAKSEIIWNMRYTTSLSISGTTVYGLVLAPWANVFSSDATIVGQLWANSYSALNSNGVCSPVKNNPFDGDFPSSSAPSTTAKPSSSVVPTSKSTTSTFAAPTSVPPTSAAPTTRTSAAPTSAAPTSAAPTSAAPTTRTSAAPTSAAPTSAAPTSAAPTSAAPTSAAPTTRTSAAPTSAAPTSAAPTSAAPTSAAPTSAAPTSAAPTSAAPTSAAPTSAAPTSAAPTSAAPTSAAPTSAAPTSAAPTSAAPTSAAPTSAAPTSAAPTSAAPTSAAPTSAAPTSAAPTSAAPTSAAPTSAAPTSAAPTSAAPTSAAPTSAAPTSAAPTSAAPTSAAPTSAAPTSAAPTSEKSDAPVASSAGPSPPSPSTCGDNRVNGDEECDGGICCTADCKFQPNSYTCRDSMGECDIPETCSGSSSTCPDDKFMGTNVPCGSNFGMCDVQLEEKCPGDSAFCQAAPPAYVFYWDAFNVISFDSYTCTGGDVEGRLAVKNVANLASFSIGVMTNDNDPLSYYDLVVAGNATWKDGSVSRGKDQGTIFVGGCFDAPAYLMALENDDSYIPSSEFDEAQQYYQEVSNKIASIGTNAVATVMYGDGLFITCNNPNDTLYHFKIDPTTFNQVHWYQTVNCLFTAVWIIDIAGPGDIIIKGAPFPGIVERTIYNSPESRSIFANNAVFANILAPTSNFVQSNGVTYGRLIVGNVTEARQNNKPNCLNFAAVTITNRNLKAIKVGDSFIFVVEIKNYIVGDLVCANGQCKKVVSGVVADVDEDGKLDNVLIVDSAFISEVGEGAMLTTIVENPKDRSGNLPLSDSMPSDDSSSSMLVISMGLVIASILL